jgi:PAS domain S-box-containing protein
MKKILIVEDEDIISRDIKNMIDQLGLYTSVVAHSGKQALELYRQEMPDLILMDINLTGEWDGINTAMEIRKISDIPLIYLTAYADTTTVKRAKLTQPSGYIIKPFNDTEVKTNIELALYKYHMNRKLLEREQLLSSTLTKIGLGIIKTDRLLNIQFINNVALDILCLKEDAVQGKPITSLVKIINEETDKELSFEDIIDTFSGTLSLKLHQKQIPIDLIVETIRDDDDAISYVFILRDLSEKRNIESKIWKAANILERTIQSIQTAVFITSTDFDIMDCNRAATTIFGFARDELAEKHIDILFNAAGKTTRSPIPLDKVIKNKLFYQGFETLMVRKNKQRFPAEFTVAPLIDEKFNISGWVFTVSDITQKKYYENNLKKAKIMAENANQAKTEFLTNMSHELRTPLNSIIGMTELTLGTDLTHEQKENLTIVKQASHSFLHVLNNILDFSKLEVGKVELEETNFNIHEVMKDICDLLYVQAKQKDLGFTVSIGKNVPQELWGDSYKLKQILTNLIGNAIKFTEHGRIETEICVETASPDKLILHCSVKDTGIGIPHDKIDAIFESFRQIDGSMTRRYGGTGLGLAITRRLITLMGGSIWIETEQGKGSVFHFTVMFHTKQEHMPVIALENPEKKIKKSGSTGKSVLVVEDDKNTHKLLCDVLEKRGHAVFCVTNGQDALIMLDKIKFDVILMDLKMPVLDGFAATKIIRAAGHDSYLHTVPIIAITAHAGKDIKNQCYQAGMNGYIIKPIDFEKLITAVEKKYPNAVKNSGGQETVSPGKQNLINTKQILLHCKKNEINPGEFSTTLKSDLDTIYKNIKKAAGQADKYRLELLSSELKDLAAALGAELLYDDAIRIKMASRKKTMDKAMVVLEMLKPHIKQVENALAGINAKLK